MALWCADPAVTAQFGQGYLAQQARKRSCRGCSRQQYAMDGNRRVFFCSLGKPQYPDATKDTCMFHMERI